MRQSIQNKGGLKVHLDNTSNIGYDMFVLMAEANWDDKNKQYNGVRTMARIMKLSDTTVVKYLRIYDEEIGRTRHRSAEPLGRS